MSAEKTSEVRRMTEALPVYFPMQLKELLGLEADRQGIAMSELVVRLCAAYLAPGQPEMAIVPRKRMGRPRKIHEESNGNGHKKKVAV